MSKYFEGITLDYNEYLERVGSLFESMKTSTKLFNSKKDLDDALEILKSTEDDKKRLTFMKYTMEMDKRFSPRYFNTKSEGNKLACLIALVNIIDTDSSIVKNLDNNELDLLIRFCTYTPRNGFEEYLNFFGDKKLLDTALSKDPTHQYSYEVLDCVESFFIPGLSSEDVVKRRNDAIDFINNNPLDYFKETFQEELDKVWIEAYELGRKK